ncbi:hypothetical protein [Mesorhizobium sp. NPDC059025]|uniref:hypothetical protein n=1 Tax=unclassified Mesorhizobium TaxID=325217 RepID=UPI00368FCE70
MAKKLSFKRKLVNARPFENEALNVIATEAGIGGYYPIEKLVNGRLEAQMTRPNIPVGTNTIDVFFLLENLAGDFEIEIALRTSEGGWRYGGFIWTAGDKSANLTIENEVVNGHHVLSSVINGNKMRFIFSNVVYRYQLEGEGTLNKILDVYTSRKGHRIPEPA